MTVDKITLGYWSTKGLGSTSRQMIIYAGVPLISKIYRLIPKLENNLSERILILDGAYGTAIQKYELNENDFRGSLLAKHSKALLGNNDLLILTKPDVVQEIHESYLESGCDILSTNTFSSTKIAQSDFNTEHLCKDLNFQ